MDDSNTIKKFTVVDIEKYHKGQLSAKQMHDLEKAALDDPFLADAMEGYAVPGVNAVADINELKQRLSQKTEEAKVVSLNTTGGQRKFPWLRAAAAIVVIAGAGLIAQKMFLSNKHNQVAKNDGNNSKTNNAPVSFSDTTSQVAPNGLVNTDNGASTKKFFLNTADSNSTTGNKPGQQVNTGSTNIIQDKSVTVTETVGEKANTKADFTLTNNSAADNKVSAPVAATPGNKGAEVNASTRSNTVLDSSVNVYKWADITKEDTQAKNRTAKKSDADGVKDQYDREERRQQAGNGATVVNNNNANRQGLFNNQASNVFRGRVTDENNVGLPFARVMNPADNNAGTYTDVRGYFTLTYPDSTVNVQVRSIGFDNSNIQLRSASTNNQVVMQDDKSLAEVVVSTKKPNADKHRDANMKLVEPEPLDGWDNYDTYIANNLETPDEFKSKPAYSNGAVEISFEVNKYGEPVNIKVEKSLCSKCDAEAIRLVKEGPKWRRNANKKGRTTVTISF